MPQDRDFEGKIVLIGLCYFDRAGALCRQEQHHGTIVRVGDDGIAVRMTSGSTLLVPPYISSLQPAPPGTYREHSSGESITNPDFLANYYLYDEGDAPDTWTWRPGPLFQLPPQWTEAEGS